MKYILMLFVTAFYSLNVSASDFGFSNLDQSDVDNVFKEFAATFTHSTLTGASSKSKIFGFEVGLVAGATKSSDVKELVAEALPSGADEVNYLPFASLYGLVSLPFGITVEANYIPEIDVQDVEFSHLSLAGKFEFTSFVEDSPLDLAVRVFVINSSLSVTQSSGGFSGEIELGQTQFGLQGVLSKKFLLIEPYVFLGIANASGELKATGTGTVFGSSFPLGEDRVDSDASSAQFGVGFQANLLIVKAGLEYVNSFGASHFNAKLALSF